VNARGAAAGGRLLILGSSITALALVRSAHRLGLEAIVADVERGPACASRWQTSRLDPGGDRVRLFAELMDGARGATLVATTDEWLRVLRDDRDRADAAFPRILHPSNDVLDICLDKARFAAWCEAERLPAPRRWRDSEPLPPAAFPLLLRPASTLHSRPSAGIAKARELHDPQQAAEALAAFRAAGVAPILTSSLLARPLTQFSVGLARAGGRTMAVVTRKLRPLPRACRVGTLVEVVENGEVEALARRAADRLGYTGIAEIEILRTDDDLALHLIEVNARPWIQFGVGLAAGRDLLAFHLSGGRTAPRRTPRRVRWISFGDDLWFCMGRAGLVRSGELSVGRYLASVVRANVFARWSARDPGPFIEGVRELLGPHIARWRGPRGGPQAARR
jgi:predicted ATP-grasp superfamily ATP-dependent carboligase